MTPMTRLALLLLIIAPHCLGEDPRFIGIMPESGGSIGIHWSEGSTPTHISIIYSEISYGEKWTSDSLFLADNNHPFIDGSSPQFAAIAARLDSTIARILESDMLLNSEAEKLKAVKATLKGESRPSIEAWTVNQGAESIATRIRSIRNVVHLTAQREKNYTQLAIGFDTIYGHRDWLFVKVRANGDLTVSTTQDFTSEIHTLESAAIIELINERIEDLTRLAPRRDPGGN